jgi:hypothetical protein
MRESGSGSGEKKNGKGNDFNLVKIEGAASIL